MPEFIKEVRVLRPEPGDVMVLTVGSDDHDTQAMASEWLEALFPLHKSIVLGPQENLATVRGSQSPALPE